MSDRYRIAEAKNFRRTREKHRDLGRLYQRIVEVVHPMLRRDPNFGPNIKRLKGEFSEFYRYRIGDIGLFYTVDESDVLVVVADLRSRKDAYR